MADTFVDPSTNAAPSKFSGWAILELMGHRRLGGFVEETELAGAGMLKINIPGDAPGTWFATQFYSPSSLYALTPCSEDAARALARLNRPEPVHRWELPTTSSTPARSDFQPAEDADDGDLEDRDA